MKKKTFTMRALALALSLLFLLSAGPVLAEETAADAAVGTGAAASETGETRTPIEPAETGEDAAFRYTHDPRLNPRAMADIVVDPAAVYGFSPSPEGSLKQYISFDWTDSAVVNGENGRLARIAYHESIQELYTLLDEMTLAGNSIEEIARTISARRNALRLESYDNDPEGLAAAKARNLERYGHEEGPLADELYAQYGSWETVLEKAFNVNAGMDALLGLYDDYYPLYVMAGYIQEESIAPSSREYAVAAFVDAVGTAGVAPDSAALSGFSDAGEVSAWFAPELEQAAASGVLKGYEDGTMRPQETVSRIEALVLLSRCLPELDRVQEPIEFADVPDWAREDIDRLSAAGLVEGYGEGSLGAYDSLTVEQVGILTSRLSDKLVPAPEALEPAA